MNAPCPYTLNVDFLFYKKILKKISETSFSKVMAVMDSLVTFRFVVINYEP